MKFYVTICKYGTIPDKKVLEGRNLLFSANSWYLGGRLMLPRYIPSSCTIMVDSGGYSFLRRFKKYPITISEYIDWINKIKANYAFMWDVKGDWKKTQKYIDKFKNIHINTKWIPVCQGVKIEDYFQHMKYLKNFDYIAIGNIKRKGGNHISKEIIKKFPDKKFHILGLTLKGIESLKKFNNVISFDSSAWNMRFGKEEIKRQDTERRKLRCTQVEYNLRYTLPVYTNKINKIIRS